MKINAERNKETCSMIFLYLSVVYVVCLLLSNILASKLLKLGTYSITAGILVFPISYIINDILAEVYGYNKARKVIICGFALNIFMVLIFELAIWLPSPEWFQNGEAFKTILGTTFRTVTAGLLAYLFGSIVNAKVMSKMKRKANNKFGIRAIVSTIYGETTDSLIFVPIAFLGLMPIDQLLIMIGLQIFVKTLYEVICLPLTTVIVKKVREYEGEL